MNTKLLMTSSALFLLLIGFILTFIPKEVSEILYINSNDITNLFLQIFGSLYLGFGMLNWMAKGSIIGGIYNRPIVIGNLMHFTVASFALIKAIKHFSNSACGVIIALTIGYIFFAVCFGYLFISTPSKVKNI